MDQRPAQVVFGGSFACLLVLLLALSSMHSALALSVTPQRQSVPDAKEQVYQFVYSVTNTDPQPRSLSVRLEPDSEYLAELVSFQPEQFSLLPGDTENVKLSMNPGGLGPQTHSLQAGIYDGTERLGQFELLITVSGTPVERYGIEVSAEDTTADHLVPVDVTLTNYGNVLGYAQLRLDILRGDEIIGSITNPNLIQLVPSKPKELTMPFTDTLVPGFYTVKVTAIFPNQTVEDEQPFSVSLETTRRTIDRGTDIELTFASLGNPPKVTYRLVDATGAERTSGTFLVGTGDIVIPSRELPAGDYVLVLALKGSERSIDITIRDPDATMRLWIIIAVGLIALAGIVSLWRPATLVVRIWRLQRRVARQEREVTNLINRAHRLVDEYTQYAARRHASSGDARTPGQGS